MRSWAASSSTQPRSHTLADCPPTSAPCHPQIDRADGGAPDLAAQLESQMRLGGAGDSRAPLRAS
jgi:hypothetical protein